MWLKLLSKVVLIHREGSGEERNRHVLELALLFGLPRAFHYYAFNHAQLNDILNDLFPQRLAHSFNFVTFLLITSS